MQYNPYQNPNQPPVPPMYMGQPPVYLNQPAQPNVIIVNTTTQNPNNIYCNICKARTESHPRRKVGFVTIAWAFTLSFIGLPCCLCFIPFCNDSCKDLEILCAVCDGLKKTEPATCC